MLNVIHFRIREDGSWIVSASVALGITVAIFAALIVIAATAAEPRTHALAGGAHGRAHILVGAKLARPSHAVTVASTPAAPAATSAATSREPRHVLSGGRTRPALTSWHSTPVVRHGTAASIGLALALAAGLVGVILLPGVAATRRRRPAAAVAFHATRSSSREIHRAA
jgi:hypothetical protein